MKRLRVRIVLKRRWKADDNMRCAIWYKRITGDPENVNVLVSQFILHSMELVYGDDMVIHADAERLFRS